MTNTTNSLFETRRQELKDLHRDLSLLHPTLNALIPKKLIIINDFNEDIYEDNNRLEKHLQVYFDEAVHCLGLTLIERLLGKDFDFEEDIQELRLKSRQMSLESSLKSLQEISSQRTSATTMIQTSVIWSLEEQAFDQVMICLADKYTFQVTLFLTTREVIESQRRLLDDKLKNEVNEKERKKLSGQINDLRDQFVSTSMALQHLYQEFHRKNVSLIEDRLMKMKEDQSKFGVNAFIRVDGHQKIKSLQDLLSEQKITLFLVEKTTKQLQRSLIKEDIKRMRINNSVNEQEFFEAHSMVLEMDIRILNEKESMIKRNIDWIRGKEEEEEETFYDAQQEINDDEHLYPGSPSSTQRQELQQLQEMLNKVRKERARVRNKLTLLRDKVKEVKIEKKQELKETKVKTQQVVVSKTVVSVKEARMKAMKRLKEYRMKHPKDSETGEDLPPFPSVLPIDDELPLPPPPPSTELLPEDDVLERQQEVKIAVVVKDPVPQFIPAPSSIPIPPPPPPPPPPPTLFLPPSSSSSSIPVPKTSLKKEIPSLDLNQILETRKTLRKTFPIERPLKTTTVDNPLFATLMKIREVTKDDDSDEDTNSDDFDD